MGIYIKGARMPNCCLECMLYNGHGCKATMQMFHPMANVGTRVDGCPLVEVEVPHGDLIDRDRAVDGAKVDGAWAALAYEPAVIEAEGK
jgi:hypothetical protein